MRFSTIAALTAIATPFVLVAACGGGSAANKPTDVPAGSANVSSATSSAPSAAATPAASVAPHLALADARPTGYHDDTSEATGPITMAPLFTKATKPAFPKSTVSDKDCWTTISLSGEHQKDYETLIGKCGTPTGLVEYAKSVQGHLHHQGDKRDTFRLALLSGYCYRYFAVADSGIKDLDILVEKPGGAIVADDKQSSPVAIIESGQPWCMTEDATYDFHIEVDGEGRGKYIFGVWAKPK